MPTTKHQQEQPPTQKQQAYLRGLAQRAGESFTPPTTKREATSEISRLKARLAAMSPDDRWLITKDARRDQRAISQELHTGAAYAPRIHRRETDGHGSTAHWNHGA